MKALVDGYLSGPVHRITYKDPRLVEGASNPDDYSASIRECIGWPVDSQKDDEITIAWERPLNPLPYEKGPAGPSIISIPKGSIVELRRTISP